MHKIYNIGNNKCKTIGLYQNNRKKHRLESKAKNVTYAKRRCFDYICRYYKIYKDYLFKQKPMQR